MTQPSAARLPPWIPARPPFGSRAHRRARAPRPPCLGDTKRRSRLPRTRFATRPNVRGTDGELQRADSGLRRANLGGTPQFARGASQVEVCALQSPDCASQIRRGALQFPRGTSQISGIASQFEIAAPQAAGGTPEIRIFTSQIPGAEPWRRIAAAQSVIAVSATARGAAPDGIAAMRDTRAGAPAARAPAAGSFEGHAASFSEAGPKVQGLIFFPPTERARCSRCLSFRAACPSKENYPFKAPALAEPTPELSRLTRSASPGL